RRRPDACQHRASTRPAPGTSTRPTLDQHWTNTRLARQRVPEAAEQAIRFWCACGPTALHEAARRRTLAPFQGGRREPAETVLTALGLRRQLATQDHPAPPPLEPDPGHAGEGTDEFSPHRFPLTDHGPPEGGAVMCRASRQRT